MKSSQVVELSANTGESVRFGEEAPLVVICGPCVIESRDHSLLMAESIAKVCSSLELPFVYKSSYDKANRTSLSGYRGVGSEEGLLILEQVKKELGLCVISDVHSLDEISAAAEVLDILQIPAFLCRQTDLLLAAGNSHLPVMVKKGQFLHPADMQFVVNKLTSTGNSNVLLCERGSMFGYRELVVDFRSLAIMRQIGCPVVFDATHSVQVMGGGGGKSTGCRDYVPLLARAAVSVGVDAIFLECHDNPAQAPSDGPNMICLEELHSLLSDLKLLAELQLETR